MVLFGSAAVAPSGNQASLLVPLNDSMSTVDTSSAHRFGSSHPLLPILLLGEESSPILGLPASGRERKGSYTSAFPDLCGFKQLHLFLSLLEAPCGRRGSRRLWAPKDGGFMLCHSQSDTSGLW